MIAIKARHAWRALAVLLGVALAPRPVRGGDGPARAERRSKRPR